MLLEKPLEMVPPLEDALVDAVKTVDPEYGERVGSGMTSYNTAVPLHVGVEGSFGSHHVNPRGLNANFICKLVCVEGIVTKCSLVRPKVVRSVHYCAQTGKMHRREYRDATSIRYVLVHGWILL